MGTKLEALSTEDLSLKKMTKAITKGLIHTALPTIRQQQKILQTDYEKPDACRTISSNECNEVMKKLNT